MKLKNAIGGTLRELRNERDMTLMELSEKVHISIAHISDIERGATTVGGDMMESLAYGLGVSPTELMYEVYEYLKEYGSE